MIVSVSAIRKRFGEVQALDGITADIPDGISGIIGPNGAGKTTLLCILLGLIQADEGTGSILGLDIHRQSLEIRRRIGALHERPIYPPFLTTMQYLETISKLYPNHREPSELLKMVELDYAKHRKIGNLSAGMRQRLGIAQSLIGYPEVVFLDEPTSNLDITGRNQTLQLVMDLHNTIGTSFIISSHILSELERICHHLVFINEGRVTERGRLVDILSRYASNRFRIVTSDPQALYEICSQQDGFDDIEITGVNTITLSSGEGISTVRCRIEDISKKYKLDVYDVSKSTSLEEVFRSMSKSE